MAAPAKLASARPGQQRHRQAGAAAGDRDQSADRDQRAEDAGDRHRERGRAGKPIGDHERGADRSRLRRAEQRRLGQRIAQQALQRGAGKPERRADQERQQRARQPDVAHDDRRPRRRRRTGRRAPRAAKGRPGRPSARRSRARTISAASARLSRRSLGSARVIGRPPAPFLQASGLPSNGIAALSADLRQDAMPLDVSKRTRACAGGGSRSSCCTCGSVPPPIRRAASRRSMSAPTSSWWRSPIRPRSSALSPYARDPAISVVAEKARAVSAARRHGGSDGPAQARSRAGRYLGPSADAADAARARIPHRRRRRGERPRRPASRRSATLRSCSAIPSAARR